MESPIPADETERLRELAALRTPFDEPIPELQSICEVVADMAGTPVALVSLVGETEQRFAANVGLEGTSGTSRDAAFCAHAILSDGPFVVADSLSDARFAENPLVTGEPGIRAYAGIPLEVKPGVRVGTLCAIDFKPRSFSPTQIRDLSRLGQAAARILVAHRSALELQSELEKAREREAVLRCAVRGDGLTGLLNAMTFRQDAANLLNGLGRVAPDIASAAQPKAAAGNGAEPSVLVLIDVDTFKTINDSYGHSFGDIYLKRFAETLARAAGPDALVGRLGGDEFAIFAIGSETVRSVIEEALPRFRADLGALEDEFDKDGLGRASIGIAYGPEHGQDLETLYNHADLALYFSKENGRNQTTVFDRAVCCVFNPQILRGEVQRALRANQLVPFYQPKVDLATGNLVGLEVLTRWFHPTRGMLMPRDFAGAFCDRAVSPDLTRSMLRQAAQAYAGWAERGLDAGRLSLNVTVYDLSDTDFVETCDALLARSAILWSALTIEVTETVVMGSDNGQVFRTLQALRERGARIALDDFGTGYGGLQHFRSWPIDVVKIDRCFVDRLPTSHTDHRIVRAIIELAHDFGFYLVAEGIETEAQRHALVELGCDRGQGFLFGKPADADETTQVLATWHLRQHAQDARPRLASGL